MTHILCGRDGWGRHSAVIACHDREIIGYELVPPWGRAEEAEQAIEAVCLSRFRALRPVGAPLVLRSDNGLIFQRPRFQRVCQDYRLPQELSHPIRRNSMDLLNASFGASK